MLISKQDFEFLKEMVTEKERQGNIIVSVNVTAACACVGQSAEER